jgi:transcription initiation factor TFIID subunit 13
MAQNLNVKTEGVTGIQTPAREPNKSRDKKFYSDIEEMMFGFGDEWPPDSNAVRLLESFVVSYIEDLADRALDIAELRGKLDKECFMFLVRKDRKKFSRVHKLLKSNEELKTVQKVELKEDI